MSFTDQKPFTLSDKQSKARWGGFSGGRIRCSLCLKRFKVGDTVRWVYDNDGNSKCRAGNFFTCVDCDGPNVRDRWSAIMVPFIERYEAFGYGEQ